MLKINPVFKSACRELTQDEFKQLEASIRSEGCRDAILLWNGEIVDGHNRYAICQKYGIEYRTADLTFASVADCLLSIIGIQLGRRNLTDLDRAALLEKKGKILKEMARENQKAGLKRGTEVPVLVKSSKRETKPELHVRKALAKEAGMGEQRYAELVKINQTGIPKLKDAVRNKEISARAGAKIAALPEKDQADAIEQSIEDRENKRLNIKPHTDAFHYCEIAISQLTRIRNDDPQLVEQLDRVVAWIEIKKKGAKKRC